MPSAGAGTGKGNFIATTRGGERGGQTLSLLGLRQQQFE